MIESVLTRKQVSLRVKITVKTLISASLIVLAVILPQLFHFAFGAQSGIKFLPMYLPVILGGCLLGIKWGVAVGALSPLVSFLITSAAGNPMPALARLPFMAAELVVFAAVAGAFSKKIAKNALWAFPAVISAQIVGRAAFLGSVAIFQSLVPFTPALIWSQIVTGITGLALQAVFAPLIVIALKLLLDKKGE